MNRFPRAARLLSPPQFKRVLEAGRRRRASSFTGIELPNASGQPRLGITASKKSLRRAVDRNRFKRAVRESFRRAPGLPACDVVIMATPAALKTSSEALTAELGQYWDRLRERWLPSSSSSSADTSAS